jgi:hypothetical protein
MKMNFFFIVCITLVPSISIASPESDKEYSRILEDLNQKKCDDALVRIYKFREENRALFQKNPELDAAFRKQVNICVTYISKSLGKTTAIDLQGHLKPQSGSNQDLAVTVE